MMLLIAMFEVENYGHYVQIQSEAALREMETKYPYDAIEENHSVSSGYLAIRMKLRSFATISRGSVSKTGHPSIGSKESSSIFD